MVDRDESETPIRLAGSSGRGELLLRRVGGHPPAFTVEILLDQILKSGPPTRTTHVSMFELIAPFWSISESSAALSKWISEFPAPAEEQLQMQIGLPSRRLEIRVDRPTSTGKMRCAVRFEDELCKLDVGLVVDLSCLQELHDGLVKVRE
jgi:hypothetical protein